MTPLWVPAESVSSILILHVLRKLPVTCERNDANAYFLDRFRSNHVATKRLNPAVHSVKNQARA